jgi:nucleoside-diphosphate-sugar epimerase
VRVLVAGASGVIGRRLVRILVASGHRVTGTTRSPERAATVRAVGATPLVVDVFNESRLGDAVASARPEVVVHLITDLPDRVDPTGIAEMTARNARIRTQGTRHLVAAALRAGSRRLVAQSIAWAYARGPEPHPEADPLDTGAEGNRLVTVLGVTELERLVTSIPRLEGLVLRYGQLHGLGTWNAEPVGNVPLHVEAAAHAAALAVVRGEPGAYNIVEDGGAASNAKARAALGWDPGLL